MISPLHPVLDKRLTSVSKVKLLRSDGEIFRAKLWWDHLPSQGVRARGCTTEAQDAMQCDFCTRKCAGSTWHIMAECPATPLLEARKTGSEQLQELASKVWRGVGVDGPNPEWEKEFTMEGGEWRRPRDCPKGDPRAGNVANPWYGIFSAAWLDRIIAHALPSQRVARVDAGKKALRALSYAAVKVCRKVWQQAAKLWAERARTAEERIKTPARRVRAEKVRQRRVEENRRRAIARVQE